MHSITKPNFRIVGAGMSDPYTYEWVGCSYCANCFNHDHNSGEITFLWTQIKKNPVYCLPWCLVLAPNVMPNAWSISHGQCPLHIVLWFTELVLMECTLYRKELSGGDNRLILHWILHMWDMSVRSQIVYFGTDLCGSSHSFVFPWKCTWLCVM